MSSELRYLTRRGLLLAAVTVLGVVQQPDGAHARGGTPNAPEAPSASSANHPAVLARIDSLWEADAGLAAREFIRQSAAAARAEGDSLLLLNLLCREGRLLAALNRPLEAEPLLREGLLLATALNEPLLHRVCLRWLGVALIGRGRLKEVQACFDELLRLSQESGDKHHEGYAWMGLAYCDWRSGAAADAREKYDQSVAVLRGLGDVRGELWALTGLNNALTMLGAYEEAMAGNRRIIAIGEENGMREIEALGHNNLGVLLFSLGDPGEALSHFQEAARLQKQRGNPREAVVAGQNVCICEIALGRTREASRQLRELTAVSRDNAYVDLQISLLRELAYAHLQQRAYRPAARMFREALRLSDELTLKDQCEVLMGLSKALAGMDSAGAALELLRSKSKTMLALEDARMQFAFRNEMAARLLDEGLAAEAFETAMVVERRGAELGLTAYRLEALPLATRAVEALDRPDSALALLRRGAALWETDRGVPLEPEWREQRGAAARKLFVQLTRLLLRYPADRSDDDRIREAFDELQTFKARTLFERMLGPGGREVPVLHEPPVTLETLQSEVLLPDELLLDFVIGPERSILFACTADECRALILPAEAELNGKLRLYHDLLAARPPGPLSPAERESIAGASRNLAGLLLASCSDLIGGSRHVIVVPDGALNLLPFSYVLAEEWEARPAEGTDGPSPNRRPDGITVSRIPSATVLARLRRNEVRTEAPRGAGARVLALAGGSTDRGEPLPGTKKEVAVLARRFGGVLTQPSHMSADAFSGFDILHFAAHSTADDQSPWRSSIQLGAGTDSSGAIALRASEIAGWKLPARLVVLSGCESAGGRFLSGEGVQGLSSAFLSAGAQSVLATLWPVDDAVTVRFMSAFYGALSEGSSASAAVRSAQSVIRSSSRTAHPFYWAGFVLIGDGGLRVDLLEHRRTHVLWWMAALVPVVVWFALVAGRKKYHASR